MILPCNLNYARRRKSDGYAWTASQIAEALGTYPIMCGRVRRQWVEEGLDAVLSRKKRATPPGPPIFDGETEAKLERFPLGWNHPSPGNIVIWRGLSRLSDIELGATIEAKIMGN